MTLDLFTQIPEIAAARRSDPRTSHEAAESIRGLTQRHETVYRALRALGPSADWQLEDAYDTFGREAWWVPQTAQSIRSRRAMLCRYGIIATDGTRMPSPNGGHSCLVWAAIAPDRAKWLFGEVR